MSGRPGVVVRSGSDYVIWVAGAVGLLGMPVVGTVLLVRHVLVAGPSISGPLIFVLMYTIQMLGATVGMHRYLSHRSFVATQPVKIFLCIAGSMSQGPVLPWAANHRRHHQLADRVGDLHSPYDVDGAARAVRIGSVLHAHYGWIFRRELAVNERYVADWLDDPVVAWVDSMRLRWGLLAFVLPAVIGAAASGGTAAGGWDGFLWGCFSLFCVQHAVFSINSVCHLLGSRPYRTSDRSTNHPLVGIASFGEGWHNNHHAFPTSARFGFDRFQPDVGYRFILLLERLGLVSDVKHGPTPAARSKKQQLA